jgi:hypothetical protein
MRRLVAAITMMSYLAACTSWQVTQAVPERAMHLRITQVDGTRMLLYDSRQIGDSVVGFAQSDSGSPSERLRVALPYADLRKIERKQPNAGKTILAVVGLGAVIGLIVVATTVSTTDPNH